MSRNEELFERAQAVIPGGVNSPVRSFRSVGGTPFFVKSASGSTITDADGRTYIDYVQSWGASILGHATLMWLRRLEMLPWRVRHTALQLSVRRS